MLRAIIVDDEERGRQTLERLLERFCSDVNVIDSVDSVDAALSAIEHHRPELLFLDIEMPFENGFDLLDLLPESRPEVIFTTAYDQYALRAAKSSVIDYLLKPIGGEELVAAVAKARRRVRNAFRDSEEIDIPSSTLPAGTGERRRLAIPTDEGLLLVRIQDIVRCVAERCYTRLHMLDGREILVSGTLKEFEEQLPASCFARVHHSHLINLEHVRKYSRNDGGKIIMCDNAAVLVSRRRKEELVQRLLRM